MSRLWGWCELTKVGNNDLEITGSNFAIAIHIAFFRSCGSQTKVRDHGFKVPRSDFEIAVNISIEVAKGDARISGSRVDDHLFADPCGLPLGDADVDASVQVRDRSDVIGQVDRIRTEEGSVRLIEIEGHGWRGVEHAFGETLENYRDRAWIPGRAGNDDLRVSRRTVWSSFRTGFLVLVAVVGVGVLHVLTKREFVHRNRLRRGLDVGWSHGTIFEGSALGFLAHVGFFGAFIGTG